MTTPNPTIFHFSLSVDIASMISFGAPAVAYRVLDKYCYGEPDPLEVLSEAINIFHDSGALRFEVGGFDKPDWPVSVWMDLALFVEDLGALSDFVLGKSNVISIVFAEQGIERVVWMERIGDFGDRKILMSCRDLTPGKSFADGELIGIEALNDESSLRILLTRFLVNLNYAFNVLCCSESIRVALQRALRDLKVPFDIPSKDLKVPFGIPFNNQSA